MKKLKINLINKISRKFRSFGIAGGQYLDLSYENKSVSKKKIIDMEIKKTGKLFSFCCVSAYFKKKNRKRNQKI